MAHETRNTPETTEAREARKVTETREASEAREPCETRETSGIPETRKGSETRDIDVQALRPEQRPAVRSYLEREPHINLPLLDALERAHSRRGAPELFAGFHGAEPVGVLALQPSALFDAEVAPDFVRAVFAQRKELRGVQLRSRAERLTPLPAALAQGDMQMDRIEHALLIEPGAVRSRPGPPGLTLRRAEPGDSEALLRAGRGSLLGEGRPDPLLAHSAPAFRFWVTRSLHRAVVGVLRGRVVFCCYREVCSRRGWFLQGVYTEPSQRRRGIAAACIASLCKQAFVSGAAHVQLSVVDGNRAGMKLYTGIGFRPFARLRVLHIG